MVAVNHLSLLLYERVPISGSGDKSPGSGDKSPGSGDLVCEEMDLVSVVECSVEQGVFSACSLPTGDVTRASVYTVTLAISTDPAGSIISASFCHFFCLHCYTRYLYWPSRFDYLCFFLTFLLFTLSHSLSLLTQLVRLSVLLFNISSVYTVTLAISTKVVK
jgi:hypothetical protein